MNKESLFSILIVSSTLMGCATYKEEFSECGPDKGIPCKTLPEVHQIVNQQAAMSTGPAPVIGAADPKDVNHEEIVLADHSVIQRAKEQHLRIWIAPFQDDQGNFHEASIVHSVVRPSFWQMQTIQWGQ